MINTKNPENKKNNDKHSSSDDKKTYIYNKERYNALKHKYLIQDNIKKLDKEKIKELEQQYQDKFGKNEFGEINMSPEEREEYFKIQKEYEKKEGKVGIEKIKKLHVDLMRAPLPSKFENFPHQDPNKDSDYFMPSVEQVRIMMNSLNSELLSIFNEYFSISFYKTNWKDPNSPHGNEQNNLIAEASGGAVLEKYKDDSGKNKFRINIDIDSFTTSKDEIIDDLKWTRTTFNKRKFLYIINRCILSTIKDKSEFIEFAKKSEKLSGKKLDENCNTEFDDWLAFFFANPEEAKNINPELYEIAINWLKNGFEKDNFVDYDATASKIIIKPAKYNSQALKPKGVWKDTKSGEKIESKGWLDFLNFTDSIGLGFLGNHIFGIAENFNEIKLAFQEGCLYGQIEDTDNEVKRLMARELSSGDYHKLLRKPLYYNDEDKMKALIFVLAKKSAYHWQFGQLWLWRWDPLFEKTNGKEISMKGFDFINKVSGISGQENKIVKTSEYKQSGTKFIHVKYEDQIKRFDNIFETFSLRDIQRAKPDLFNNLYCPEKNKFLSIDAKLGQINMEGKNEYYIQNDVNLADILPKGEAENFVKDMQQYSKNNHEKGFNQLVDPVVVSMVKKYLQESRREPMLFNMFTSPMVRRGFEYYKDFVDEPENSKSEYDRDYEKLKNDLEESHYDPEDAIESKDYESIDNIYKNYGNEENELPYTRGKEKSKFGKIKELMRQSQIKVEKLIFQIQIPEELKNYISSQLLKFNEQSYISTEEINEFNHNINKKLSNIDSEKSRKIRKIIDEHLKDLEKYSVIKGYQSVFKSYESAIKNSVSQSPIDSKKAESIKKWYLMELLPEKGSVNQKIVNITNYTNGKISFSLKEQNHLAKLNPSEALGQLTEMLMEKLSKSKISKEISFENNYQQLNNVYFNANQALLYPEQFKNEIPKIIDDFKSLSFIPVSIRESNVKNINDIIIKLRIAKVVADNYYNKQQLKKQYQSGRNIFDYEMIEEEDEYLAEAA